MQTRFPNAMGLPEGVLLQPLRLHRDVRGSFAEIFRASWPTGVTPIQWNVVTSEPGVLRGVHVHIRHADYLFVPIGRCLVGLKDLLSASPTWNLSAFIELGVNNPSALTIPVGVAHGFLFFEPSLHIYSVSEYFNPEDELGCHWADPELDLPWPEEPRLLSSRDREAGSLTALRQQLEPYQHLLMDRRAA